MTVQKEQVERQFNRAASSYDRHAAIQRVMADRLLEEVTRLQPPPRRFLEIGCGTGYLTQQILHRHPGSVLTAVDLAATMIEVARKRLPNDRVHFVVGDAESIDFDSIAPVDCVVSNATIQWFTHPQQTLNTLTKAVSPDGWLWVSTFGPRTFQELNGLFLEMELKMGLPSARHSLPLAPVSKWVKRLHQAGLSRVSAKTFIHTVTYPDCRRFLCSIQQMGASYGNRSHSPLQSSRLLSRVIREYDCRYRTTNGVRVTYEWFLIGGQASK